MSKALASLLVALLALSLLAPLALASPQCCGHEQKHEQGRHQGCKGCVVVTAPRKVIVTIVKRPEHLSKAAKICINKSKVLHELTEKRIVKILKNVTKVKELLEKGYTISEVIPIFKFYSKRMKFYLNLTGAIIVLRKGFEKIPMILDLIKGKLFILKPLVRRPLTLVELRMLASRLLNMTLPAPTFRLQGPSILVNVTSLSVNITIKH